MWIGLGYFWEWGRSVDVIGNCFSMGIVFDVVKRLMLVMKCLMRVLEIGIEGIELKLRNELVTTGNSYTAKCT